MNDSTVIADGRERKLGCLARTLTVPGDGVFRLFGEEPDLPKLFTRAQIEATEDASLAAMRRLVWYVIDQGNQGSCCGCMGVGMMMLTRRFCGLDDVVLSQASLYGQGNGGRDEGMAIDTCMNILTRTGATPTSVIDQYDWRGFHRKQWPDDWEETGKHYMAVEALDCPDTDYALSAVVAGHPVGFGYFEGRGGHAVTLLGKQGNDVLSLGSWSKGYGENGIHRFPLAKLAEGIKYFGAWALRVTTDPSGDGDLPQLKERVPCLTH